MVAPELFQDVNSLIRSATVKLPVDVMLLLGAGASVTSGVLSGWQCIWDWKLRLFLTDHPTIDRKLVSDTSDPRVRSRVQTWLKSQPGTPAEGSPGEYGYYAEACYPRAEDRRRYFEKISQDGEPGLGYRALGRMLEQGQFRWIWTTNFDDLVQRGRPARFKRPIRTVGLDSTKRLQFLTERDEYINLVHLHGDYRYDALKNTAGEVQSLHEDFLHGMRKLSEDLPLLVVGYSGGDQSIMSALNDVYGRPGKGALYWTVMRDQKPSEAVVSLIQKANANGYHARLVEFEGFDNLMLRFSQVLLPPEEHAAFVRETHEKALRPLGTFSLSRYRGRSSVAKANLWELTLPEFYWACKKPDSLTWRDLRDKTNGLPIVARLLKEDVIALGTPDVLRTALGVSAKDVRQEKFTQRDLQPDTMVQGALTEFMARSFAGAKFSVARFHNSWLVYDPNTAKPHADGFRVARAASMTVHFRDSVPILAIVPDRHIFSNVAGRPVPDGVRYSVQNELSKQYNKAFNEELQYWRGTLGLAGGDCQCSLGGGAGSSAITVRHGPQFAEILSADPTLQSKPVPPAKFMKLKAIQLPDPELRFARGSDKHPLRGVLEHGPIESKLPRLDSLPFRLGVCSATSTSPELETLFEDLVNGHETIESRENYLFPYGGFERVFGIGLRIASNAGHVRFNAVLPETNSRARQQEALARVCRAVDQAALAGATVVMVIIPDGWEDVERVELHSDSEDRVLLDLHDLIKAHAAPRGIRTQLFRETSLKKRQRIEVVWWLALALYAKSNRTPWMLDTDDDGTVHVGIGYGLDHTDSRKRVVMCCSHIYQASGIGLKFQLSEIGAPAFFRRKNPFLKREDAYRVGERALQAVFDSRHSWPRRVCISKRTPFTRDEQEGFCAALERVPEVELLTVEMDDGARLVRAGRDGNAADGFPVQRGTVVQYGAHEALIWIHGDTSGISSTYGGAHYYQGGARIPGPLRLTRFVGSAPLEQLAADLLGLSKMDWNSFDLYGKIPVHLSSPGRIARVARLMEGMTLEDRDYRLFM